MGNHGATPPPPTPPPTPHRPAGHEEAGPPSPPKAEGTVPPPPAGPRRLGGGPQQSPPPRPQLPAPAGTAMDKQTRAGTQGRQRTAPGNSKRAQTGAVCGPRPPWPERRQRHPLCCLPREGRGTDRGKATPRPTRPPATPSGERRAGRPPPPTPPPGAGTPQTRRPNPREAHSPKPGSGETGPGRPPPPKQARRSTGLRQDTRRGTDRVERPYQRSAPGPRGLSAPHQPGKGGGERTPREREHTHTHTQRTRGEYQKGNRTEPAERTDRMEWRTSERG